MAPDDVQVVQDGLERNFRPDGPPLDMNRFRHRHLECQTPRRGREHNSAWPNWPRRLSKHLTMGHGNCGAKGADPKQESKDAGILRIMRRLAGIGPARAVSRGVGCWVWVDTAVGAGRRPQEPYSSGSEVVQASGAASSNRVWRARKTKLRLPVGPLRCLAMMISALARSSSGRSVL